MSMMQPTSNRGGYRKPENPAPVSGPGALSERTDGGPTQAPMYYPDTTYGQGGYVNQQTGAAMAGRWQRLGRQCRGSTPEPVRVKRASF